MANPCIAKYYIYTHLYNRAKPRTAKKKKKIVPSKSERLESEREREKTDLNLRICPSNLEMAVSSCARAFPPFECRSDSDFSGGNPRPEKAKFSGVSGSVGGAPSLRAYAGLSSLILRFPPNFVRQLNTKARRNCSNIGVAQVVAAKWSDNEATTNYVAAAAAAAAAAVTAAPPVEEEVAAADRRNDINVQEIEGLADLNKAASFLSCDGSIAVHAGMIKLLFCFLCSRKKLAFFLFLFIMARKCLISDVLFYLISMIYLLFSVLVSFVYMYSFHGPYCVRRHGASKLYFYVTKEAILFVTEKVIRRIYFVMLEFARRSDSEKEMSLLRIDNWRSLFNPCFFVYRRSCDYVVKWHAMRK